MMEVAVTTGAIICRMFQSNPFLMSPSGRESSQNEGKGKVHHTPLRQHRRVLISLSKA